MQVSKFRVKGASSALTGSIAVSGAKNDALKGLAVTLLMTGSVSLQNVPQIEDVFRANELLKKLGVRVSKTGTRAYEIDTRHLKQSKLDFGIAESLRASIMFA